MYSKILVALDGSRSSEAAARHGVDLAKATGAAIVAIHVAPPFISRYFADAAPMPGASRELWESGLRRVADRHFTVVRGAARDGSVPLATDVLFDEDAAGAIDRAAASHGCDLIVIARNGGATRDRPMGPTTAKLLAQGRIPVLVYRAPIGLA